MIQLVITRVNHIATNSLHHGHKYGCVAIGEAEREKFVAGKSGRPLKAGTGEAWCSKFRCNTSLEGKRAAWEGREINQRSLRAKL